MKKLMLSFLTLFALSSFYQITYGHGGHHGGGHHGRSRDGGYGGYGVGTGLVAAGVAGTVAANNSQPTIVVEEE
ncbi:hypothetical protein A3F06_01790 [candidate division TM6 bacterium RIFCSPHIGHO2_12_FULL_36_22]|nr:MAG: hypothetical protein A3F06_01790 [candidate division TM6 bacterium RIFCSPHIGHO2_12_FULL_36_22]